MCFAVTVRKLRKIFGYHNLSYESTVHRLIEQFENRGSVQDIKSPGNPRSGRSEANIAVAVSPGKSCRRRARKMRMSTATMQIILKKDLHLQPYNVQLSAISI